MSRRVTATARPSRWSAKSSRAVCPRACGSPPSAISVTPDRPRLSRCCGNRSRLASNDCACRGSTCFFLHSNVVPDTRHIARRPDAASRMTLYATFVEHVRPCFEKLVAEGLIGAWGLTGIGHPDTIIRLLGERPAPAAVQCIANLLDSPGALKFFGGPAKPRDVMAAARANGVGVMGIRAVQAGALTSSLDRPLPADHPEMRDYARAAGFRQLAAEIGMTPAPLAHRYALSLPVDTLVLGVKNRSELAECVAAAEAGRLPSDMLARIDKSFDRAAEG